MAETPETFNRRMQERDDEDFRTILKTAYGRRFVWKLMRRCGIFKQSFIPGDTPQDTAFNEGRRSIGNTLLGQVNDINPEAYLQMVKANKKEEEYARQCEPRPDSGDE